MEQVINLIFSVSGLIPALNDDYDVMLWHWDAHNPSNIQLWY